MTVYLCVLLRKSTSEFGVKLVLFYTLFRNVFVEALIKSINYCQFLPLAHLLMYIVKNVCQVSMPLFLTGVNLAIFCLDQYQMEILCSAQHQLSLVVPRR